MLTYLDILIIDSLSKLNGERTIFSVYHLLKGKKSSQTIQDAHLYGLFQYFQNYSSLTRENFISKIDELHFNGKIQQIDKERYIPTDEGLRTLKQDFQEMPFPPYVNGLLYHPYSEVFWARISLIVQVLSYQIRNERHFYPIQKDPSVLAWLKYFLKKINISKELLAEQLFDELHFCLKVGEVDATIFVSRLSGYKQIGLTNDQVAYQLSIDEEYSHIQFLNALHYLIQNALNNGEKCKVLSYMIEDIRVKRPFTFSTLKTFELIQLNKTIEEIALIRHLKKSTIEDHIVEITLTEPSFSIDPYVNKELQDKIKLASKKAGVRKLKPIKDLVPEADYYQIRLVIAKNGDKIWI